MREADEEKEEKDDDETTLMKLTVAQLKERLRTNGLEAEKGWKKKNAAERAMSFLDRLTAVLNSSKKKNSMHERSAGKTPTSKKMTNTASTRKRKISFGADTSPRTTPASSKRRRVTFEEESLFGMRRMRYTTAIGIVLGTAACVLGGHLASVAYLMDGVA